LTIIVWRIQAKAAPTFRRQKKVANQSAVSSYCDGTWREKNNQTTPTAKKTTPPEDPANGKEEGKQTATGNQKQTTEIAANTDPAKGSVCEKSSAAIGDSNSNVSCQNNKR